LATTIRRRTARIRDYIHVVDLAEGHLAALDYIDGHQGIETVNLGTGVGYSVFEVIEVFESANNLKLKLAIEPRRPGDAPVSYADPAKAKRLLHWQARKGIADMCRDAWRWQALNPNGYKV